MMLGTKNIQFRVMIPSNATPGQLLRIRCPDGTEADVRVPKGLTPGNSFIFEMPADALMDHHRPNGMNPSGGGGTGMVNQKIPFGWMGGFLDREIVDQQDFMAALAVGVLVGLSIVVGFLGGVLLATEP